MYDKELDDMVSENTQTINDLKEEIMKAENRIKKLKAKVPKWHKVSEGNLPKNNSNILVSIHGHTALACYMCDLWVVQFSAGNDEDLAHNEDIDYWCELPQPPKDFGND